MGMLHLGGFGPVLPLQETLALLPNPSRSLMAFRAAASGFPPPSRRLVDTRSKASSSPPPNPNLRRLTSRIVELTRRKQLNQILKEVHVAKGRYGKLNTIVMNAVLEACVRCGDVDSALRIFQDMSRMEGCGVDGITFAIILKGLGEARRVDEAFQLLEFVEQGATVGGGPKLTPQLLYGLLNALLEAGDMRRANGLVARYRAVLHGEGNLLLLYNLLMKGYANTDFPLGALTIRDEILRQGLQPDKLTYNTLVFACVKCGQIDAGLELLAEMKEEAQKADRHQVIPDVVTYTTLLKGLGNKQDLLLVQKIIVEMKSLPNLHLDRTSYTAMVDALLSCGSIRGALCIFGEIIKQANGKSNLCPKPHLYLSLMRAIALRGDYEMVNRLHTQMWSASVGTISPSARQEADELLMEAAVNDGEVIVAQQILNKILRKRDRFSWSGRGGMVAIRVEVLSGFDNSILSPYMLPQILLDDPVEKYMTTFEEANPLPSCLELKKAVMRFLKVSAVPIVDDWGSCIGIVHCEDCTTLDAPLSTMMRGPPPCATTSTSIARAIDLMLEKKHKMLIIVRTSIVYDSSYSSSSRPAGVLTRDKLFQLASNHVIKGKGRTLAT